MGLKINRLELRAHTGSGSFGADLGFEDGLCVVSAGNTKGKSTSLNALIYCLGLERMFGPRRQIPLPYAMQSFVRDELEEEHAVLESYVLVEISNRKGDILTVRRNVKGEIDTRLVSTWRGPIRPGHTSKLARRDYYVLDPGAATREAGFHRVLAEFIGWELPSVGKYDGSEAPLYMELLFPLFFIEQKEGWTALPASFPTFLGIREAGKRAVEFVMGFKSHEVELQKQRLRIAVEAIQGRWADLLNAVRRAMTDSNARVEGIPEGPQVEWPPVVEPTVLIPMGNDWQTLEDALRSVRSRIAELQDTEVRHAEDVAPEVANELNGATEELQRLSAAQAELVRRLTFERSQRAATSERLRSLEDDLRKNQDAQKLLSLGSDTIGAVSASECPTCHQSIDGVLLPNEVPGTTMTIDQNIAFIREQLDIVRDVEAAGSSRIENLGKSLLSVNGEIMEIRARIRALKQTLIQASGAPAIALLQERVALDERLRRFGHLSQEFRDALNRFAELAESYTAIRAEQQRLPKEALVDEDRDKLSDMQQSIQQQTRLYEFSTFPPRELEVSPDTYRPIREGFDIGFELSASDAIRLKWAYHMALLEVARTNTTNHPGVVILDEPGQQEVEKPSLRELLRRATESQGYNQQVIITTSEDRATLRAALAGTKHQLIEIDGYLLKRVS